VSGHDNCCKNYSRPKTLAQFAALTYPSNPGGHSDIKNRIHNTGQTIEADPQWAAENKSSVKLRKGWWFKLDTTKDVHLLDGSGDGMSRGIIRGSNGWKAKSGLPVLCFNACALKMLTPPGASAPVACGFTWNVTLKGNVPPGKEKPSPASGWIPLDSINAGEKTKKTARDTLKGWACCVRRYRDWGKSFTKPGSALYKFRSVGALADEIKDIAHEKVKLGTYFKEAKKGSVRKVIKQSAKSGDKLQMGIHPSCRQGNRLTDYLPKGLDFKGGYYENGYTNLSTNVSFGAKGPLMAPIALDILPANHEFHRLKFKGDKRVYGFVYSVPKKKGQQGKLIGRVEWFYGYCDVVSDDPQKKERRYGWVPALAVRKV